MSIANGNFAFRMLYVPQEIPADAIDRFIARSAPTLDKVGVDAIVGWCGYRHALDTPVSAENSVLAGYMTLILRKAERKVPAARLKAECAIEEQAHMKATGKPFVDKKTRKEIKAAIVARLLPGMEPTLSGLEFVYDGRDRMIYTNACSDKQLDAFTANWLSTIGVDVVPVDAGTAALARQQVQTLEWGATSFSPEVKDYDLENTPGADFLTWLWYSTETGGGVFNSERYGEFGVAIEGPLLLERNGAGAHETSLRKGLPTISDEAKTALMSGKKLHRAKLVVAKGEDAWAFGFDADAFVFRGVKLPESKEVLDAAARFQHRVVNIGILRDVVLGLYDQFVAVRNDAAKWAEVKAQIHAWVTDKAGKK